jgi:hypothetical protein
VATSRVNGFVVDVTVKDAIPTVRISFADGKRILETSDLSINGMERIGAAFARAARMAYTELDHYYYQRQEAAHRTTAMSNIMGRGGSKSFRMSYISPPPPNLIHERE